MFTFILTQHCLSFLWLICHRKWLGDIRDISLHLHHLSSIRSTLFNNIISFFSFQTCQADSGFSQKHHAVEFSRFSTNDSHTISYNYHPLYLLTRLFDESDVWGFPFRLLTKNQTLFDTAQMEIFEHFNIQVAMLSELPQSSINYRQELVIIILFCDTYLIYSWLYNFKSAWP